jgi:hypothetical protein
MLQTHSKHRSTFAQEAAPSSTALTEAPPALNGYVSRFLPANPVAWRQGAAPTGFTGNRPLVEAEIARKEKRDAEAAQRQYERRSDELMRGKEKEQWRAQVTLRNQPPVLAARVACGSDGGWGP